MDASADDPRAFRARRRGQLRTRTGLAAVLVALVLVTALSAAGVAATSTSAETATISPEGTSDAENATVRIALEDAPDGLAGFELRLTVEDGTVAGASYPDHFEPTTDPAVSADGRTVTVEAADLQDAVSADASDVTLATVAVTDLDGAAPSASLAAAQIDADGGARIDPGAVTISVRDPAGDGGGSPADESDDTGAPSDGGSSGGGGSSDDGGSTERSSGTLGLGLGQVAGLTATVALVGMLAAARITDRV